MHQYRIDIFKYSPAGAVEGLYATRYADNPEQARMICEEFDQQKQSTFDENGIEVPTEMKKFQVRLYLLCYKLCSDKAAFFAQFQA